MSNFMPSLEGFAKGTFATVAGLSTLSAGLLWYGQNYLIYPSAFPQGSRVDVATPEEYGIPFQHLTLETEDKVSLKCYLLPQQSDLADLYPEALRVPGNSPQTGDEFISSRPTVIMFHGNGGNHGHRIPLAKIFFMKMRCNVLMMSYRGYGHSEGSPSEKGIRMDAQAALNYLLSDPRFSQTPIILYGQSIGGAVSIDLASRNPDKIAALILENTFTSLPDLIPHALPVLSRVTFLCHQKWDSASKISLIPATTPILMLSGKKDQLIPREHMSALWEIVTKRGQGKKGSGSSSNEGKGMERGKYIEFEFGDHSACIHLASFFGVGVDCVWDVLDDTCVQPGYWAAIAEFVASLGDDTRLTPPPSSSSSAPKPVRF
ncbi:alpha/beta-hydrolase [Pluteus cervinus]|uniref:Alpha/beta-hydrolase n=1 Tax=Pluteus cervinus TaxID=181527 RepID=A0ACD3AEI6_9AGAR|nr:alpha/beta-hydrolase [Pluteus cervinus]